MQDFPPELVVAVFAYLTLPELVTCQYVCRSFKDTINNSVQLQYQMELEKSGMIHNPNSGMCASDCLEMLKKREEAWSNFEPVFKRRIHVGHQETGIYEISGGTYFLGESKRTSIPFLRLPSTPDGDAEWDKLVVGCKIIDIGISLYEHDLFTAIVLYDSLSNSYHFDCLKVN